MTMTPDMLFLDIEDPARWGLPAGELGNVLVAVRVAELTDPVTVVVDPGTALLIAHAGLQDGYDSIPMNLDAVRWIRPGWPMDWVAPADPSSWLDRTGHRQEDAPHD